MSSGSDDIRGPLMSRLARTRAVGMDGKLHPNITPAARPTPDAPDHWRAACGAPDPRRARELSLSCGMSDETACVRKREMGYSLDVMNAPSLHLPTNP